jgi:hypothetical protein
MVDGYAVGAGSNLALCCDLIVASDRARFGEVFCKIGLAVDGGDARPGREDRHRTAAGPAPGQAGAESRRLHRPGRRARGRGLFFDKRTPRFTGQ